MGTIRHIGLWVVLLAMLAAALPAASQQRGVTITPTQSPAAELKLGAAYALVIGNNQYKHLPVLQTAVSDAAAVAELLRGRYDFAEVELILNASRADILTALARYRRNLEPEDRLLIYYAGHGLLDRQAEEGYWLPVDAEEDISVNWISNASITTMLKAMLARQVMIVADSCYSGALTRSAEAVARPAPGADRLTWLSRVAAKRARTALVSGGLEPVVDGGRNGHSVFASAFLDVLRENDGLLDGQALFDRLKGQVVVNADQTPAYGNVRHAYHEGGDFIFAPRGGLAALAIRPAPVVPAQPSPAANPCMLVWQGIADSERRTDFEAFLAVYPDCPMAPIARARLGALGTPKRQAALTPPTEPVVAVEDRDETLVALKNANVRAEPRTGGRKLTTLSTGTKVAVTGRVQGRDWLRVALAGGETGYVWAPLLGEQAANLAPAKQPETKLAVGVYPKSPASGETFRDCVDCPEMVVVPAGSFIMGSPNGEAERADNEAPQHRVTIPAPFAVGRFEVTRGQFEAFVVATGYEAEDGCYVRAGEDWTELEERSDRSWRRPGFAQTERDPVVCMSWDDAKAYATWLSRMTGHPYRLLSEAEWEHAARAGTTTARFWGEGAIGGCAYANGADLSAKSKYSGWDVTGCRDGHAETAPVGSFRPNAFGLHDMLGNAWEWVEDCYRESYVDAPTDGSARTNKRCDDRVLRGGSWYYVPGSLRSAFRGWSTADYRYNFIGFRVARTLPH